LSLSTPFQPQTVRTLQKLRNGVASEGFTFLAEERAIAAARHDVERRLRIARYSSIG